MESSPSCTDRSLETPPEDEKELYANASNAVAHVLWRFTVGPQRVAGGENP